MTARLFSDFAVCFISFFLFVHQEKKKKTNILSQYDHGVNEIFFFSVWPQSYIITVNLKKFFLFFSRLNYDLTAYVHRKRVYSLYRRYLPTRVNHVTNSSWTIFDYFDEVDVCDKRSTWKLRFPDKITDAANE